MNKYQEYILKSFSVNILTDGENDEEKIAKSALTDCTLRIIQSTDADITAFPMLISINGVVKLEILKKDWEEISASKNGYRLTADFGDRFSGMRLSFVNNIAAPIEFNVEYIESDKEQWENTLKDRYIEGLFQAANVSVATGADLVNIYFQPCSDEYAKTEIILYRDNLMLAKYRGDEEMFFKSITGLAYGNYTFILKQYDKNDKMLLETEHIEFSITPNGSNTSQPPRYTPSATAITNLRSSETYQCIGPSLRHKRKGLVRN